MNSSQLHTDKELLQRIANGDGRAFRSLFLSYAPILHTFLLRHTESKEMAEEIVQDIFLQIWLTRETLQQVEHFQSYLFVISRNRAFDAMKKLAREKKRIKSWLPISPDPLEGPSERELETGLGLIDEAIKQLPPQQNKVWIMSRREGLTYTQIAAKLNISRETVKSYLQTANGSIVQYVVSRIDLLLLFVTFLS